MTRGTPRRPGRAIAAMVALVLTALALPTRPAAAATAPVSRAAPYLTLGWGDPPDPTTVMAANPVSWMK